MARKALQVRREELLRAAVAQIERRGIAATRIADVAAALRVSPALVLYHFQSKEQLIAQAFAYAAERDLERLDGARAAGGDVVARLRAVLRLYAPAGRAKGWTLWIESWSAALRDPGLRKVAQALDLRWKGALAELIGEGVAGGEFRCPDPRAAAWRITAFLDGLAVQLVVRRDALSQEELQAWLYDRVAAEVGVDRAALGPVD